jgi:hypothetical protein
LVFGGGKCSRTIVWIHHHNWWFCDQGEQVRCVPTYVPGSKSICCLFFAGVVNHQFCQSGFQENWWLVFFFLSFDFLPWVSFVHSWISLGQ